MFAKWATGDPPLYQQIINIIYNAMLKYTGLKIRFRDSVIGQPLFQSLFSTHCNEYKYNLYTFVYI